jgi:hypothetical protein
VRTDSHQLRPVAGDSAQAEVTRAHKTLVWELTRHTQRLRHALRDYFPAALEVFEDLDAADALELLARAQDPGFGASAEDHLGQCGTHASPAPQHREGGRAHPGRVAHRAFGPACRVVAAAYEATIRAAVAVLTTLKTLKGQVDAHRRDRPDRRR